MEILQNSMLEKLAQEVIRDFPKFHTSRGGEREWIVVYGADRETREGFEAYLRGHLPADMFVFDSAEELDWEDKSRAYTVDLDAYVIQESS